MSTFNDGGAAFSQPTFIHPNGDIFWGEGGMTLRDYFAAKAMAGMLSNNDTNVRNLIENSVAQLHLAQVGYAVADAMLAAQKTSK